MKNKNTDLTPQETITKDNTLNTNRNKNMEIEGPEDLHIFNVSIMIKNKRISNKFEPCQDKSIDEDL